MVKYFSVDWLAQSHQDAGRGPGPGAPTGRPHIPCTVPPRPPAFGRGYLQPKAPTPTSAKHVPPAESDGCASPVSENSGYSSGYESEAASSECLSVDEGREGEKDAPQRRARTKFTPEQISKLEKIFSKHKYLDAGERVRTARKLRLTETQVRTWFQNRRMKLKREVQDYLAPPLMFQPLPPVRYHNVGGQQPRVPGGVPAFYPLPVPQTLFQQQLPAYPAPRVMVHGQHFY